MKVIFQLEQDDGTVVGEDQLKKYITKKLFGSLVSDSFSMDQGLIDGIPHLT